MRILLAHSFYRLAGGEDSYVLRQRELLLPSHKVELITKANSKLPTGVSTALRMTWSPALIKEVKDCIDTTRAEVVHLHNPYPGFGAAVHLASESCGVPLVVTVHSARMRCPNGLMFTKDSLCQLCEGGNYANAIMNDCFPSRRQATAYAAALWIHRGPLKLEQRVAAFIAPSRFMATRLQEWGIAPARVEFVPNFAPIQPTATTEPGSYGLYLGRLASEKGLDVLLQAIRGSGDPPFRIVGTGPLEKDVQSLADRLHLSNTEFYGHLNGDDMWNTLRAARFVVLPSVCMENAPMAGLEALSLGRPLLVSRAGGLPELVESGAGASFSPGDVGGLSQAIQKFMADDECCQSAGEAGLEYSRSSLSPRSHQRALERVYERALDQNRRR
jgi:glycosyltransferase involved in cell wall biosynthesis